MKKKLLIVSIVLNLLLGACLIVDTKTYYDLLEVNDELISLNEDMLAEHTEIVEKWEKDYLELKDKYADVIAERDQYSARLDEVDIPLYEFTEAEVYLMAQVVEAEAGYSPVSQRFVTQVILNRLHSSEFPNKVYDVLYQKVNDIPQFSVVYNGMIEERIVQNSTLTNVYSALVHGTSLPEYVLYFYSDDVTGNWVNKLNTYDTVDGTIFAYHWGDKKNAE